MNTAILRRLQRLEQNTGSKAVLVVMGRDETAEQAVARYLENHPKAVGANMVVVSTGINRAPATAR